MKACININKVEEAINGSFLPCSEYHDGVCLNVFPHRFKSTLDTMYKMYIPIHVIPFLLFKRKKMLKDPSTEIPKLLKGYVKSLMFAASYTGVLGVLMCTIKNFIGDVDGTIITPVGAFFSGITLAFENHTRQQEIALFLVPKVIQAFILILKRRRIINSANGLEVLAMGLAMALLGYFYQVAPNNIKQSYLGVFRKLLGDI